MNDMIRRVNDRITGLSRHLHLVSEYNLAIEYWGVHDSLFLCPSRVGNRRGSQDEGLYKPPFNRAMMLFC